MGSKKNILTRHHQEILGEPSIISDEGIMIWNDSDAAIVKIALDFGTLDVLIDESADANNFGFQRVADGESESLLVFAYFYDYPVPEDNGFILFRVSHYDPEDLDDYQQAELYGMLKSVGLDMDSEIVKNQIRRINGVN